MRLCLDIILIQLKKKDLIQFELRLANVIKLNFISFFTLCLYLSLVIHDFQLNCVGYYILFPHTLNFFVAFTLVQLYYFQLAIAFKEKRKKIHSTVSIVQSVFFALFSCHFHFISHKMPKRIYFRRCQHFQMTGDFHFY